jgi:Spy/CpxP family protein refolding chaperone
MVHAVQNLLATHQLHEMVLADQDLRVDHHEMVLADQDLRVDHHEMVHAVLGILAPQQQVQLQLRQAGAASQAADQALVRKGAVK